MADNWEGWSPKAGATSQSIPVRLISTAGAAVTGKAYTDITASYWRQGGSPASITPATLAAINSAYSSGGFKEANSTKVPGDYRLDVPDAAFATGAEWVLISVSCTGAVDYQVLCVLKSTVVIDVYNIVAALSTKLGGITNLGNWLRAMLRKTGSDATAVTEINSGGGTYDAAEDSQEALRDRGDAAWMTATGFAVPGDEMDLVDGAITAEKVATGVIVGTSPTAGAYTVTITVEDADSGNPIPNVFVIIKGSDDIAGVDQNTTDENGEVVFGLNAGDYKVHLALPPAYQSRVLDLTVNGIESETYALTPITIGAPSAPDLCRVYGYEYLDGTAVENREVKVRLINTPQTTDSVILERTEQTHTSDADGYWYFDLVREKKYRLVIDAAGVDKVITAPDAVSVDARTLL